MRSNGFEGAVSLNNSDSSANTDGWRFTAIKVLRSHWPLFVVCLIYIFSGYFYAQAYGGQASRIPFTSYFVFRMAWPILVIALGLFVLWQAYSQRPKHLLEHCWHSIRTQILTKERIMQGAPVLLIMPIVFATFTNIKVLIPEVNPFQWDAYFAEMDRVVHFGRHPWEWLQPVLGYPLVTKFVHAYYLVWLVFVYVVLFWQTFTLSNPFLRMRFLISFVLSWALIGSIGGTVFASAGPVYFERVVGDHGGFGPLMDYLKIVFAGGDEGLILVQERLWETYETAEGRRFAGISAMPSMHVTMVAIIAFLGWGHSRLLGILFTSFAFLILVGSVHLAWHYAVDGYAGILAAWLLWLAVGAMLRRYASVLGLSPKEVGDQSALTAVA